MGRLTVTLLGDFQARLGLGAPLSLKRRKTEALLAYCALPPGQRHSRDKLAALLWGDRPLPRARSRLRETVFVLRRALATADPPCLELGRETLAVAADAVDVDAVAFERLVRAGGPEALARAVDLYRGDLLQGLAFRGALFEDWLMDERERLRELALDALAKLLAHQQSSGAAEAAVPTALRLIALDPLQEAAHRTVMRLYAQLGRRGAALRQYQLCVGILLRELGAEPEAGTRELYEEILRRRPQRGTSARVSPEIAEHKPFLASPMIATPAIPLIGREGEVTWLRQALAQARAGLGRVGVIVGEAGVGKTRLIAELVAEALPRGARLLLGRCYESDQILPFGPWVDAFRTAGVSSDRRLLAELAPPWRAELARLLPEVDVPGLPEPGDNQLRLFESVGHLLERLTSRQPTVVVLEDLHWADEMTLRLLAYVTRRIAPWPLLLMVTAREEDLAEASAAHSALRELGGQLHAGRLTLFPLSRADTRRLTQALARAGTDARAVKRLVQQVWAASEGNPFVAVETTRALQEGSIGGDARTLALPQRVRELIAGQMERLSERAHEIVSVAAVIGREFEFALLARAGGLDEAGAARAVEELVRRRALHGVGERFGFTHERVRAVVYDRLLPPRRKLLHRQVGEAIETVHAEDLEPHYAALGAHYREGEVWDRAASYLGKAGKTALTRFGFREAAAYFEQALAALTHLPETRETREQAIDLRFDLRNALDPLAELGRIEGYLREAEILARALDDQRRLGWALVFMSDHQRVTGSHATAARTFAQRARAIAETLHDVPLEVAAQYYLVTACHTAGDYRGTEDGCRRLMQLLQGDRARERFGAAFPIVVSRGFLARALAERGVFDEGGAHGQDAIRMAEALDHPYSLVVACRSLAHVNSVRGALGPAGCLLERAVALCRDWSITAFTPLAMGSLGHVYAWSGRIVEGVSLLREAVTAFEAARIGYFYSISLVQLGEAYLLADRIEDARASADRAVRLARERGERGYEAYAQRLLGETAARSGPPVISEAEARYREALALAGALGMRPLAAHCHLGLGKIYRRTGNQAKAREHLTTATALYREMDMGFWLEKVERD